MPADVSKATPTEYAKTLPYVTIDLGVRALSAIALVIIGIAGWRLQNDAQQQRLQNEQYDRLSRQYLPVYRTFTDLELVLQDGAEELLVLKAGESRLETFRGLSYQLRTAAASTFVVEKDLVATVELPVLTKSTDDRIDPVTVSPSLSVRATAFMVADVLRVLALAESSMPSEQLKTAVVQMKPTAGHATAFVLLPVPLKDKPHTFVMTPTVAAPWVRRESAEAWKLWNGTELIRLSRLRFFSGVLVQGVHQQTINAMQQLMRERPELGDQFVNIRRDALREHAERREARRRAATVSQTTEQTQIPHGRNAAR